MSAIETILHGRRGYGRSNFFAGSLGWMWRLLQRRRELQRTRLQLFMLSDDELRDIGLTRELAEREAARSLLACYLNNSR